MHWVVHFDARGKHNLRYRCKNVNLVEKTVKGVEDEMEFLFVPCVLRCARVVFCTLRFSIATPSPPPAATLFSV